MIIEKYGVVLRRLTHDKIELVRNWRNNPKISQYMEFQDHITAQMQEKWFKKINNDNNFFFILEFEGKEVGLVNVKDVDYNLKQGEGGVFICDDNLLNSTVAYRAILLLNDFCFEDLKLTQMIAHIRSDNKRAIAFNKVMGFKIRPNQEDAVNQLYSLCYDDYYQFKTKIIKYLK